MMMASRVGFANCNVGIRFDWFQVGCETAARFMLLQLYDLKLQKSHTSVRSVHNYHKSFSWLISPFNGLLQLYELELQKFHISGSSIHNYHKSCSELN